LLKANYEVFEKKRVKIFVRGFRGVSPLNILRHRNLENSDDARGCPLTLILSPVGRG